MWQKVCSGEDLPIGGATCHHYESGRIGIFRIENGLFAIDNNCPHHDADLHLGEIEDDKIYCPLHSWRFSITNGQSDLNSRFDLQVFEVKEEDGYIWVDPDSGAFRREDEEETEPERDGDHDWDYDGDWEDEDD